MENVNLTYRPRIVDSLLEFKLKSKGAVLIEGPKWCGKTTTGSMFANDVKYMDDIAQMGKNRILSETNPQAILKGKHPLLIDEWQIYPTLWDAARRCVDQNKTKGQFIFTGSATPVDKSKIIHSGTGRFTWLTMRTMSLFESDESTGNVSLEDLFLNKKEIDGYSSADLDDVAYLICRGGWPEAIDMDEEIALTQAYDYFDAVVQSDVDKVDGVNKNKIRVEQLMRSYARHQATQASYSTIANDISNDKGLCSNERTVASYINALKNIFVIEEMPAWNPNLRSKTAVRTTDTRYFSDPSIATAALGIGPNDLLNDINTMGLFFETMCIRDLRIYAQKLNGKVYHYRDSYGLECDSVVHLRNGQYGLIEIKLGGDTLIEDGANNLNRLEKQIDTSKMNDPSFKMVLVGVCNYAYKRKDDVFVVPIGCLKP